jgi:hypothetical protein
MPQRQSHRGQHPEDARLFGEGELPRLRAAVHDYSFLLTRGYAHDAGLKLVGDRYQLDVRQRRAVLRAACSDESLRRRQEHRLPFDHIRGEPVLIDGYNLLITAESILGGGILLRGRDGCIRDMASIHGSYRKVAETVPAIALAGELLAGLGPAPIGWVFDAPVSNSGRLRALMLEEAGRRGWEWSIELANDVDRRLAAASEVVLTSDGWILDRAQRWCNVVDAAVAAAGAQGRVIDTVPSGVPAA